MLGGHDVNFLRYLTVKVPLSVFENRILSPLERKYSRAQLRHVCAGMPVAVGSSSKRKLHLYVSVPFCAEDCSYCHCTHYVVRQKAVLTAYEDYLSRQASFFGSSLKGRKFSSVYLGGGTPSLFSEEALDRVFSMLFRRFDCSLVNDVIFEGHPASLGKAKLSFLQKRGVTRLTIGVQSLDRHVLKAVGRHQTSGQALRCIEEAKCRGIPFVNVDLVAGLPGQTVDSFLKGLKAVIALAPEGIHVNPFSDMVTSRCNRDNALDLRALMLLRQQMMHAAKDVLEKSGYYREGFESYQRLDGSDNVQQSEYLDGHGDILGIGFGAQSIFYGRAVIRDVSIDAKAISFRGCEADERYMMANYAVLHLLKGVVFGEFQSVFGRSFQEVFKDELILLERAGLVCSNGYGVCYRGPWTPEGLFEYFSLVKILFGKGLLDQLRVFHACTYDPGHEYTFTQDGFISKMNDAFFLLTLYDNGY